MKQKGGFEEVLQELEEARKVQMGMLPQRVPEVQGFQIAAHCAPAVTVGGDFYDFISLPDNKQGIMIGDAVGHGIASALLMAMTLTDFRFLAHHEPSAAAVLNGLNYRLTQIAPTQTAVTAAYAVLDSSGKRLSCAMAGMQPLLIRAGSNECIPLIAAGIRFPLGITLEHAYKSCDIEMDTGDILVLYTDGVPEAKDHAGNFYGFGHLEKLLVEKSGLDAQEILNAVLEDVQAFAGDYPQEDDITIVVLRATESIPQSKTARRNQPILTSEMMIKSIFQYVMPPSLIERLIKSPAELQLQGERRLLTVLFSDIRQFTNIERLLSPQELISFLNEYLSAMTDIIFDYDGMLDKYVGDEIMALWGAPVYSEDHVQKACFAAIEMQKELSQLDEKWAAEGKPQLHAGIGINTGEAIIGHVGSRNRMSYTPMGHSINLGARIEGETRKYGADIIISEYTYEYVKDDVIARELDKVYMPHYQETLSLYDLIAKKESDLSKNDRRALKYYNRGLQAFKGKRWDEGIKAFKEALRASGDTDVPSRMYVDRCEAYKQNPPGPDWDGVYVEEEGGPSRPV